MDYNAKERKSIANSLSRNGSFIIPILHSIGNSDKRQSQIKSDLIRWGYIKDQTLSINYHLSVLSVAGIVESRRMLFAKHNVYRLNGRAKKLLSSINLLQKYLQSDQNYMTFCYTLKKMEENHG